jgi:hypothetical protein
MKAFIGSQHVVAFWLWLAAVTWGSLALVRYESAAGPDRVAPTEWPGGSKIARSGDAPTLVIFVHPECPCTRASLAELERILVRSSGRVRAFVVVVEETGFATEATPIWRAASAVQGVNVLLDPKGMEARIFQAMTSGRTLLYSAAGRLLFAGGITAARGHAGDNEGSAAVSDLLRGGKPERLTTPVFGCPLFGPCPFPIPNDHRARVNSPDKTRTPDGQG